MKLYAAMVIGIAIGAGVALLLSARELEDAAPGTSATPPVPGLTPPAGTTDSTTGA